MHKQSNNSPRTRFCALILSLTACLGLAACGPSGEEPGVANAPAPQADAATAPASTVPDSGPVAVPAAPRSGISETDLLRHIGTLASDEFGGRSPMSEGERLTLDYLESEFRRMGLEPMFGDSYRQAVPLVSIAAAPDAPLLVAGAEGEGRSFAYGPEVMHWTTRAVESISLEASELVWVGYGIVAPEYNWNDYAGLDVRGKTVVMLVNDPGFATGNPELFNGSSMTYYGRWTYKYEEAARQGAAGAYIIHQTESAAYGWNVVEDSNQGEQFHLVTANGNADRVQVEGWLQLSVAEEIFQRAGLDLAALTAAAAQGSSPPRPLGLTASVQLRNTLAYAESFNVGALRRGSSAADELFIYMAHWDHLGTAAHEGGAGGDFIFNGAEDNASGTSGLLEIAEAFSQLETAPLRSVGFLAVTAEESGLLGSKAYAEQPAFPMARTVAGINMDRLAFRDLASDVVVVGHGASEMENLLAEAAQVQGRTITPEPTPEKGYYYRSDHFNFAKKGVPILYARGGTTSRSRGSEFMQAGELQYVQARYHSPADEIQPDWVVGAAIEDLQLFFDIGWRVANSEQWPAWYEGNEFRAIREQSLATGH